MTIHIIITMVLLLAFLIGSIWYAKKKYQINLAVLGLGAVAFFVSSQILEKLVHILVLHPQKDGSIALLQDHPLVYIIYGLAMAAFFEETARLVFFKWLEKKRSLEKADSLAYGLGHGGLELIYLGLTSLINLGARFPITLDCLGLPSCSPEEMDLSPSCLWTTCLL